jgi:ubiquinone/menaquinone biosynthesis C-methylase UbiE
VGDAQALPFDSDSFDLVLAFTMLSCTVDDGARRRIADEMMRVARPGGLLLIYDFWINPFNPDNRPLLRREVRALFPQLHFDFRNATLAPPLVRLLARMPGGRLASTFLELMPFIQTHYLAVARI